MSKFYSLFSSSKGNASFIGGPTGGMLVDAGATCRKLVQSLEAHGLSAEAVQGICITHTHTDHIKGLRVFLNQHPVPVYGTAETLAQQTVLEHLQEQGMRRNQDFLLQVSSPEGLKQAVIF